MFVGREGLAGEEVVGDAQTHGHQPLLPGLHLQAMDIPAQNQLQPSPAVLQHQPPTLPPTDQQPPIQLNKQPPGPDARQLGQSQTIHTLNIQKVNIINCA